MRKTLFATVFCSLAAGSALAQPRIDRVDPAQGPIVGGTVGTVLGAGFSGASVTLDQKPVTPTSITDTRIQLTAIGASVFRAIGPGLRFSQTVGIV